MKYIHLFEQFDFYDESWQDNLPKEITIIYKNQEIEFIKRAKPNALPHQIQIKYDHKKWGEPDTFEIDIEEVFDENNKKIKLIVSMTYGDLEVAGFSIEPPNTVSKPFTFTSFGSKFDPSNTVFALSKKSLSDFCKYINSFGHGIKISPKDLYFLSSNYHES